ncbi:RNA polymerase sigma factor [Bacillus alkalicola]|uniref:RNA polymerase sigma factor n=1 Tax=Evansella alkalicola TaxID=745819 RepID=A0ABS6JUF4_9BACI|nr:RNA polymerase sigma factor [Bacillus alkalicola]
MQNWYGLYHKEIFHFILIMIGDEEQAKDLTQDTFIKAFEHIDNFQGVTSDKNWLYKIARNVTIDYIRKKKPIRFMVESFTTLASRDNCPEKITQLGEMEEQLYKAMKRIKRSYQEVIFLRKIKELSIEETAEILDWNKTKVKNQLFRGLTALKREMVKEGYEYEGK